MSSITRCPACATSFKVVPDQLKVSGGWVRCGHCAEVFDARASMQTEAPIAMASPAPGAALAAEPAALPPEPPLTPKPVKPAPAVPQVAAQAPPTEDSSPPLPSKFNHSEIDSQFAQQSASPGALAVDSAMLENAQEVAAAAASKAAAQPDVSFVRKARAQAFWRKPVVRACLGLVCLALLAVLAAQVAYVERDRIAAIEPRSIPTLKALCTAAGCELAAYKQIESLAIDSSTFNKLGSDTYRLNIVLKNAGVLDLAMPSLDLALTDTQDQSVVRRIVTPKELGATSAALLAGGEFTGSITFKIDKIPVSGYRVSVFYP